MLQSLPSCGRNLGLTQFSFFLSLSFFVSGQVGEEKEEKSPIVCTSCSHIWRCRSSTRRLIYLLQRERSQNKLSSTLFPERQKVKVCGLWHFKVVSGQRTESECLLQLPARGGRWIQSWKEAEESGLIQRETSLGWTRVRIHTAYSSPSTCTWAMGYTLQLPDCSFHPSRCACSQCQHCLNSHLSAGFLTGSTNWWEADGGRKIPALPQNKGNNNWGTQHRRQDQLKLPCPASHMLCVPSCSSCTPLQENILRAFYKHSLNSSSVHVPHPQRGIMCLTWHRECFLPCRESQPGAIRCPMLFSDDWPTKKGVW